LNPKARRNDLTVDGAATRCPEHRLGGAGPQRVDVVDAVPGQQRVEHDQALLIGIGTHSARDRDVLEQQTRKPQPLPERGRDQRPGIGHAVLVIGADIDPIQRA